MAVVKVWACVVAWTPSLTVEMIKKKKERKKKKENRDNVSSVIDGVVTHTERRREEISVINSSKHSHTHEYCRCAKAHTILCPELCSVIRQDTWRVRVCLQRLEVKRAPMQHCRSFCNAAGVIKATGIWMSGRLPWLKCAKASRRLCTTLRGVGEEEEREKVGQRGVE